MLLILLVVISGIVDKIMLEFERRVLLTKEAGRAFMDEYLKKVDGLYFYATLYLNIAGQYCQEILSGWSFS